MDALPDRQRTGELGKSSFKNVFLALFIGYFANILIPRIGEVARATSLSKKEGIRFSGVFGTVIAERVFDTVVLGLGVASLCLLFYDQFLFIRDSIFYPVLSLGEKIPVLWAALSLAGVTALGYVTVRTIKTSQSSRMMQFRRRLMSILNSFKDGAFTLLRVPRRMALLTSTVLMWFCYVLMALVTFVMLDMHTTHGLGLSAAWSIMIFGAIGFAVPAPSGTGSYHYITKLALVNLYLVDDTTAFVYTVISHGLHVIVYIITGIFALFIQGTNLKSLQSNPPDTDHQPDS